MYTICPHCSQDLELNEEMLAILRDAEAFECPSCAGQVTLPPEPGPRGVAPLRTDQEIAEESPVVSNDDAPENALLRLWRGTNRNVRILGAVALLALGGITAFIATRKDGTTYNDRLDLTNREIHNEFFRRLIESGRTTAENLAAISDPQIRGTSLIAISQVSVDWKSAEELARRTAAEIVEISDDPKGGRFADWLAETWPNELGRTSWIRRAGEARVIDSPDIGKVSKADRPRRVFLIWKDAMPRGWSWTIQPRFDEALPFSERGFARVKVGNRWGLIDHTGNAVLQPLFDSIEEFSENGSARVVMNGKTGLVNESGKLVAKPEWDAVQDLLNGFVPVKLHDKWGYLDRDGKQVVACDWDDAWRFSPEGFAVVTRAGKRGFIDRTGKVIVEPVWDGAINFTKEGIGLVRREKGWAMIDTSGRLLCEPVWKTSWKQQRLDLGLLPVWTGESGEERYTVLGIDGKPVVPGDYDKISPFPKGVVLKKTKGESILVGAGGKVLFKVDGNIGVFQNGVALVTGNNTESSFIDELGDKAAPKASESGVPVALSLKRTQANGKWGYADPTGKFVVKPEWDDLRPFEEGLAAACRGGLWGFVDDSGKIVVGPKWKEVGRFSAGVAAVRVDPPTAESTGVNRPAGYGYVPPKWDFIDRTGQKAFDTAGLIFYGGTPEFKDGHVAAYDTGSRGMVRVSRNGRRINLKAETGNLPAGLELSESSRPGNYVNRHGTAGWSYSIVNQEETEVMPDVNEGADFTSDYIPYALPPKYGLIDNTGKLLVEPAWDEARILSPERVWFRVGKKVGLADGTGKILIQALWDALEVLSVDSGSLGDDGKSVVLGTEGKIILSPWVRVTDGGKTLILRPDGELAIPESLAAEYVDFYGSDHVVITQPDAQGGKVWSIYEPTTGKQTKFHTAVTFRWNWNTAGFGVLWMQDKASSEWRLMSREGNYLGHSQPSEQKPDGWCFVEGRAILQKPDGWVLIDPKGKVIFQGKADVPRDFHEGRAALVVNGKWGFIGLDGALACDAVWDEVRDFHHGLAAVKGENGWWGFIDPDGKVAIQPVWDQAWSFVKSDENLVGSSAKMPPELAAVGIYGSWGCIDRKGRLVMGPKYESSFSDDGLSVFFSPKTGQTHVRLEDGDLDGKRPPDAGGMNYAHWRAIDVNRKFVPFYQANRFVLADGNGEIVNSEDWGRPWYDGIHIDPFSGGLISARTKDQKYGLLQRDGKQVVAPQYDRIAWVAPGIGAVWSRDVGGMMNRQGKMFLQDNEKFHIARFGLKNAKSTEPQHRHGLIVIEDPPKWGYAKLNR